METKYLVIRESVFEDCEYFAKWEIDPSVTEFLSYEEDRSYKQVVEEWVLSEQDPTKLQFTIVRKDIRQPIGRVYITNLDRQCDSLDITKMYVADENRNQGVGKEVLKELLEYCFVYLHMERVTIDYYDGNKAAAALYESIGFQREGLARNAAKKNGRYYNLNKMGLLRSEFFDKVHDK